VLRPEIFVASFGNLVLHINYREAQTCRLSRGGEQPMPAPGGAVAKQRLRKAKSSGDVFSGGGAGELAVLYAASADERVCNASHISASPANNDHFQAVVRIKVDVRAANDAAMVLMLELGQGVC